ncbi:dTDP-4-dehydrorhamnose 3,5-epimerase [Gaoshiqia sediminis]|uniref:dTDP-4-dehydrorhamnose 3,5-epimerase n=1 Tax=Gaoshiqia sediminis TaxID=2986998 RepID=A0AA41Y994_9BACT|nr:dTDP-4-dehydrorhamnose 3,5-epimerase [Gaoshiqia sediminis]MCW0481748.1 dTDP-4-dehydrorhamnose 3,5-epimerase [Gaoshiqia sediminis]
MEIYKTPIDGLIVLEPKVFQDDRGYFLESFHAGRYKELGMDAGFIQDNESKSVRGVIRGLHYQLAPHAQAKLVRVIEGSVFDVAVDLRKGSPTFGQWFGVELTGENKKQLFIPRGFAHGFSVLSETAVFSYKCDNYYHPESERGIIYNDPDLKIDWKIPEPEAIISAKDQKNSLFREADINF